MQSKRYFIRNIIFAGLQEVLLQKLIKIEEAVADSIRLTTAKSYVPAVTDMPSFPLTSLNQLEALERWLHIDDNVQNS